MFTFYIWLPPWTREEDKDSDEDDKKDPKRKDDDDDEDREDERRSERRKEEHCSTWSSHYFPQLFVYEPELISPFKDVFFDLT